MAKYTIRLDTPCMDSAGTNADVECRIIGTHGTSAWRVLDNPGDDREQGSKDYYRLNFDDTFGDVAGLELRVKKFDNDNPNWYLAVAYIAKVETLEHYELPFHNWFNVKSTTEWEHATLSSVKYLGKLIPSLLGKPNDFLW